MRTPDEGASLAHSAEETDATHYGSTLSGCVGLVCVLALPALLLLPLDGFSAVLWLARVLALFAVAVSGLGVWLVARVPAATARRPADPRLPLTGEGRVPLRELPASQANQIGFAAASAFSVLCLLGFALACFAPSNRDVLPGTLLCVAAGGALVVYSVLASQGALPVPARRWVRRPIRGGGAPPVAFLLLGGVSLVWALLIAFEAGYAWAAAATTLVILLGALAGPLGQRLPPYGRR